MLIWNYEYIRWCVCVFHSYRLNNIRWCQRKTLECHKYIFNNSLRSEKKGKRERILNKVNYYLVELWISSAYFANTNTHTYSETQKRNRRTNNRVVRFLQTFFEISFHSSIAEKILSSNSLGMQKGEGEKTRIWARYPSHGWVEDI